MSTWVWFIQASSKKNSLKSEVEILLSMLQSGILKQCVYVKSFIFLTKNDEMRVTSKGDIA